MELTVPDSRTHGVAERDSLYDSRRSYVENKARTDRDERGT
ncbi:hypothetical protein [Natronorubrum thiooxidans]|uniref:Uncharacterized protein n=1 Tax=Natronorubrum thiooxidans TaxID=308853 RepID=A0A1N7GTA7_9EURY|nr:hypothetical protein SAMN05421752_11546 [Natronorubrum thiooxidans]